MDNFVKIFLLASIIYIQTIAGAWGQGSSSNCKPVGRVLSGGDRNLVAGSLLCQGDRLNPLPGKNVQVLCFLQSRVLSFIGLKSLASRCQPPQTGIRRCPGNSNSICWKPRGDGASAITLNRPYGSLIVDNRPLIAWTPVQGATRYLVEVHGNGISWQRQVQQESLPYPADQPALAAGNAYEVGITAYSSTKPLAAESFTLNLLSLKEEKEVDRLVDQVKSWNLPPDELALLDLDSIYYGRGLMDKTITQLRERCKDGTNDPAVYRLLGDRLLEAGSEKEAKDAYRNALQLALRSQDTLEIANARAGLSKLN